MAAKIADLSRGDQGDDVEARYAAALALRDDGRRHPAAALIAGIIEDAPEWLEPRLELVALLGDKRGMAQAVAHLCALFRAAPEDPRVVALIEELVAKRWMEPQIEPLAELVCARGDATETVWLCRLFCAVRGGDPGDIDRVGDRLTAVARSPRVRILGARLLARAGAGARAQHLGQTLLDEARVAQREQDVVRAEALLADLGGAGEQHLGSANVVIQRTPGATATVVAFSALNLEPALPREQLYALLQPLGANLVTLTDPHRLLYLMGLPPLGDTFTATVEALSALCSDLGAPRLLFMGNSGGSFAAIRYALDMPEVDQLLLTGPVTVLDPDHPVMARPRARPMIDRLMAEAPSMMENLRPRLEARRPPVPIVAYYGEGHGKDAVHADNIDGAPGVTLCSLDSDAHELASELMGAGTFPDILAAFVQGTLTPDRARELGRLPA